MSSAPPSGFLVYQPSLRHAFSPPKFESLVGAGLGPLCSFDLGLISWLNSSDILNSFLSTFLGVSFSHHADRILVWTDLRVGRREKLRLTQVVDLGGRLDGGTNLRSTTIVSVCRALYTDLRIFSSCNPPSVPVYFPTG